jgi:hypothetical protein
VRRTRGRDHGKHGHGEGKDEYRDFLHCKEPFADRSILTNVARTI